MNATTKAQYLINCLNRAEEDVTHAIQVMHDADISSAMWGEIVGIQNNLYAVIQVLEANENDSE